MMQQTRKADLFGTVKENGLMGGTTGQKGGVGGLGAPGGLAGGNTGPLPRKEGWLTKLGFSSGKWKQRWFTINDTGFFYQNAPGQPEKGRLYLDEETVIYPADAGMVELGADALGPGRSLKTPVPENSFTVTSKWWGGDGMRTFYFTAPSAEECEMWMLELHNYILGKPPSGPVLQPLAAPTGFLGAASKDRYAAVVTKGESGGSTSLVDDMSDLSFEPSASASAAAAATPEHKARMPVGGGKQLPLFPKDPTKPGSDKELASALEELEKHHLPKGMAGFVVSELPEMGSLGEQYGLQVYDLIYEVEGVPLRPGATKEEFGSAKEKAFQKKGSFSFRVHNFLSNSSHTVTIIMPPGKHTAILGITTSPLPYTAEAIAKAKGEVLYVKGFEQKDGLFVASAKAWPLLAASSEENAGVYCQVFRQQGASMVPSQIYHPLYKYGKLSEPLFVEVWRMDGPVMVQTAQKYAQLPMSREQSRDRSA